MTHRTSENFASAEDLFLAGNRHMADGDAQEAKACFREAITLVPDLAEAHANLGLMLDQAGMLEEAESHYLCSIACNSNLGQTHLNLGAMLARQKRFEEADAAYRLALELAPDSPAAWSNLGVLQACRKQEDEAEQSYRKALELDAGYRLAQFNLSYLLLRQGRFEEGWKCLEARNWYAPLEKHLTCPRWRGEPLDGKSLLIGFEAGHGDMIQLCRYSAVLKARGAAKISVICHPGLKTLFATLDGVDSVIAIDEDLPTSDWDYWSPPLSIPLYCQTRLDSIPASLPYLRADKAKAEYWSSVLARDSSPSDLRVGLVWKGNPRFENDADRSLPNLELLASLGSIAGVRFFSMQKGAGEEDAANPPRSLPLVNLGPQIADFADTAAIVANLDLVICVDTAVAHLAGAMGKACWVVLPDYKTDWRWLTVRSDSPWYPGVMRLFRQPSAGDWTTVVNEVRTALQRFVVKP
ncbi:MAG: tetratricopeptide repeat-containing glycosyltransferase family protein [Proteobacteria bacterium]|nr:tetratricopeptide repeat-containing glycosyltransferase family protein [Pseudomonadota bacterium]